MEFSAIITFIGAIISSGGAAWATTKHNKKPKTTTAVIFFGAISSATGAIISSHEQDDYQRSNQTLTTEIKELNKKIITISDNNKHLIKESLSTITGGDGFTYMTYEHQPDKNLLPIVFINQSKYPQYDISSQIVDMDKKPLEQALNFLPTIPNISPNSAARTGTFLDLSEKNNRASFNVYILARNGSINQQLRMIKVKNTWTSKITVTKTTDNQKEITLFEQKSPNYPE